jgi:Arylsulfotransferase (ASST)
MLLGALPPSRRSVRSFALAALALAAFAGAPAGTAAAAPSSVLARAAAVAAPGASACTPQALGASAQLDGAVTVSPMPGAADASPQTQISFLGVPASALSELLVIGSRSGIHGGRLEPYSQGDGGSFVPRTPFTPGEVVRVAAQLTRNGTSQPLRFSFRAAVEDPLAPTHKPAHHLVAGSTQSFVSRPDLRPPVVTVHTDSPLSAPGDELLAPYGAAAQAGPMILDPSGKLVWFDPLPPSLVATNLRVQQFDGQPVLTWWQGTITHGFGVGEDVITGSHYQTIAEVRAGNGDHADLHEFQITAAGTALLTAYNPIHCDLAALGAGRDSAVTDSLLQEIDIRTGLVMFQWDSLDHIPLSDSYARATGSTTTAPFDFFHLNSINLDSDGTLLVSSRNTWSIDDIDSQTGQVLWTLGGKQSSFTEGIGAATAFQHDARPLGPGTYSVFDNGASPQTHAQSRGVVLSVNTQTHTVAVQSQYLHRTHPLLADSQGDMQALANGDWFIGWGQQPDLSEFSPTGALLFDASLPSGYESYRALRFPWVGTPPRAPGLALREHAGAPGTAYASWNGATQVASWELLEGISPGRLARIRVVPRAGFETAVALAAGSRERFVAVAALDTTGAVLGRSAAVALGPVAHTAG